MSEAAELVRQYKAEQCQFQDLVDFVKCQQCFSTLMDQITEQLGSSSDAAANMASLFPEMLNAYGRETGLYTNESGDGHEDGTGTDDGGEG